MTDRELVAVFWATCAAIVAIWFLSALVRLGVDRQDKADAADNSPTAPEAADSPSAADPTGATGRKPF